MAKKQKPKNKNEVQVIGTRKKAVARATLKPGKGVIRINSIPLELYSPEMLRLKLMEPLILSGDYYKKFNIDVSVLGGGLASRADAARLAIAKALDESCNGKLKKTFIDYDRTLLVADVRQREDRKPNCAGKARAKVQKSYR